MNLVDLALSRIRISGCHTSRISEQHDSTLCDEYIIRGQMRYLSSTDFAEHVLNLSSAIQSKYIYGRMILCLETKLVVFENGSFDQWKENVFYRGKKKKIEILQTGMK